MSQTSSPLLGRCKECDYALFASREDVQDVDDFKNVRTAGVAYRVGNNGHFGRCDQGHRFFILKSVKGTYSKDHKCDSRCLNARGHNCTCSCGGANHGRGHAITHVATAPTEVVSTHIGHVGNYIRGTATVTGDRDLGDSRLYTFLTPNGAIIKWFVPKNYDPGYVLKQSVSFRAKVKAHKEFRGVAETVVTYLEEVTND